MESLEHALPAALTVLDAARIACVGRSTIYDELAAGRLVAKKIGRRTIITAAALQSWLDTLPAYVPVAANANVKTRVRAA
jgi:excisionase family DNA binding protein